MLVRNLLDQNLGEDGEMSKGRLVDCHFKTGRTSEIVGIDVHFNSRARQ
jgi:hypothetical protein